MCYATEISKVGYPQPSLKNGHIELKIMPTSIANAWGRFELVYAGRVFILIWAYSGYVASTRSMAADGSCTPTPRSSRCEAEGEETDGTECVDCAVVVPCLAREDDVYCLSHSECIMLPGEWGCDSPVGSTHSGSTRVAPPPAWWGCLQCTWFPLSSTMMRFWWLCGVPPALTLCVFPLELVYGCLASIRERCAACSDTAKVCCRAGGLTMELPVTPVSAGRAKP